jgi:hypothetical protein
LDELPLLLLPLDLEREGLDFGVEDRLGGLYEDRLELLGLDRVGEERFMLEELFLLPLLRDLIAPDFLGGVRREFGL